MMALCSLALALLALAAPQPAGCPGSPEKFLRSIYDPYRQDGYRDRTDRRSIPELRRRFTTCFARAVETDERMTPDGYAPTFDFDLFAGVQDNHPGASEVAITVTMLDEKRATARVTLRWVDFRTEIDLYLLMTSAGWRIGDIAFDGHPRMSHTLRRANGTPECGWTQK